MWLSWALLLSSINAATGCSCAMGSQLPSGLMPDFCYKFIGTDGSSLESDCQSEHGAAWAAVPRSAEENLALTEYMRDNYLADQILIGLTDDAAEGSWQQMNGMTVAYNNWDTVIGRNTFKLFAERRLGCELRGDGPERERAGPDVAGRQLRRLVDGRVHGALPELTRLMPDAPDTCYIHFESNKRYDEAITLCTGLGTGAQLAALTTYSHFKAFRAYARIENDHLWVGIEDQDDDGVWTNPDGSTLADNALLDDDTTARCARVEDALETTRDCGEDNWFVCSMPCPCASSPCANGGVCSFNGARDGWACTCPIGYTGTDCATVDAAGWTYSWANDQCYGLATGAVGWWPARTYCHSMAGAAMASVHSQAELDGIAAWFVSAAVGEAGLWVGLNDESTEGSFEWSDATAYDFTDFWAGGEPDGTSDNCGYLSVSNGQMYDKPCSDAYVPLCQKPLPGTNLCLSCLNGATCEMIGCNDNFTCSCAAGWTDYICSTNIDECASDPCTNGGTCVDLVDGYVCNCYPTWTSTHCEIDVDECAAVTSPCLNLGTCTNEIGSFTCDCSTAVGWTGTLCDIDIDECVSDPCQNGGTCGDLLNGYTCTCESTWTSTHCEVDVDECLSLTSPCSNLGTCVNEVGSFACDCSTALGWTGTLCDIEITECISDPCQNGGTCNDILNGFTCTCESAWTGTHCDIDVDECTDVTNPCSNLGTCVNTVGSFACDCSTAPGWTSSLCDISIDECASDPCTNGGTCTDGHLGYTCTCTLGWTDTHCDIGVDECVSTPCQNLGSCIDVHAGYTCDCSTAPGWTGTLCDQDLPECASDPCQHGGTCTDYFLGYTCTCTQAYTNTNCDSENNECGSSPCDPSHGTCVDLIGSYGCTCDAGWTGPLCDKSTEVVPTTCLQTGTAVARSQCAVDGGVAVADRCYVRVEGTFTYATGLSHCQSAYTDGHLAWLEHPHYLWRIEPYLKAKYAVATFGVGMLWRIGLSQWSQLDEPAGDWGWQDHTGTNRCNLTNSAMWHLASPDNAGAVEHSGALGQYDAAQNPEGNALELNDIDSAVVCHMICQYRLQYADATDDECLSSPCQWGGTCVDGINAYTCLCPLGITGTDCETNIDDCLSTPCQHEGTCTDYVDLFTCTCVTAYTSMLCEIEVDECVSDPCQNGGTCTDMLDGYGCTCMDGWTSTNCEIEVDECVSDPCQNGGVCTDVFNGFTCACQNGWTDYVCSTNVDECSSTPCQNGGTCTDGVYYYDCACMPGWTGHICEINIDECASQPCQNGGACTDVHLGYDCTCLSGWTNTHCEIDVDECTSSPCQHAGICNDHVDAYRCDCNSQGYTGVNCETELDECSSDPCQNGGTCTDLVNAFACTCDDGWTDYHCHINVNECVSNPCQQDSTCVDQHLGYSCQCETGYTSTHCETELDECSSFPCMWCMPCTDSIAGYTCDCAESALYTGSICETPISFCSSDPCQNGGTCTDYLGYYDCKCPTGASGVHCEIPANMCLSDPCQNGGTCNSVDSGTAYTCACDTHYSGRHCQYVDQCAIADPCAYGDCTAVHNAEDYYCANCPWGKEDRHCDVDTVSSVIDTSSRTCSQDSNDAICVQDDAMTTAWCEAYVRNCDPATCYRLQYALFNGDECCYVAPGNSLYRNYKNWWDCDNMMCAGDTSEECGDDNRYWLYLHSLNDTDQCSPDPCQNGGICINQYQAYLCLCDSAHTGVDCETATSVCDSQPCMNAGTCSETNGGDAYSCACDTSAFVAGTHCELKDECQSTPCQNGGTCQDLEGAFYCSCLLDWAGDVCDVYNDCQCHNCTNGATCTDLDDDYACSCVLGFTGHWCETEIDECISVPCQHDSTCDDYIGFYECDCQPGFTDVHCSTNIDDCRSDPCQFGGTCNDGIVLYWCDCVEGYTGYDCEQEIDECMSFPCVANATCIDYVAGYFCFCPPGFTDSLCTTNVDECSSAPCYNGATCIDHINHYTCACVPGFSDYHCEEDMNECISDPCMHGGTCDDRIDHFMCECVPGYTSARCETEVDECQSITCWNGGTCNDFVADYNCTCGAGFTDFHCETDIDECASDPCVHFDVCYEGVDVWWCDCTIGYTGQICDIEMDECESAPCVNGTCYDRIGFYECECDPGYTGYDCETDIDECWSTPCQYWGTCTDLIAHYVCDCIPGITGFDCEINIDECESMPCNSRDTNATCTDLINGFNCTCLPDWTDLYCDLETNIWIILEMFKDGALSDLSALRDVVAQSSLIVDSVPFVVATMPQDERWPLSWQFNDSIKWCTYQGKACVEEEDWSIASDPVMGNCMTFNPAELMHYKVSRAGQGQGLLLYMNAGQSEYAPWVDVAGFRVYVHNQSESVYAESVSYSVQPGFTTLLGLKWIEYQRLGAPYGTCYNTPQEAEAEGASYYYPGTSYSTDACIRSCYQNEVKTECGCMDPRYPTKEGEAVCDLNTRSCVNDFIADKGDPSQWTDCVCPLPCYNGEYEVIISQTKFVESSTNCKALPANQTADCEKDVKDLAKIELYMVDLSFMVLTETPRMSLNDAMAEVGGQLGIIAGMSVFSIAEIIFTMVQVTIVLLTGRG